MGGEELEAVSNRRDLAPPVVPTKAAEGSKPQGLGAPLTDRSRISAPPSHVKLRLRPRPNAFFELMLNSFGPCVRPPFGKRKEE